MYMYMYIIDTYIYIHIHIYLYIYIIYKSMYLPCFFARDFVFKLIFFFVLLFVCVLN